MKRFLQLFLVLLFVLFYANDIVAKQLTPEEALSNARMADTRAKAKMKMSANDAFTLAYTSSQNGVRCYYVFNKNSEGGFLIVSADDVAPAILGYTDSGSFDYEEIPENMKWWLSQYDRTISLAAVNNESIKRSETRASLKEVQPLIKTQWSQGVPYNDMCPKVSDKSTLTGCVATVMAQLMYYHKWPATGTGSNSYDIEVEGQTVTPAADFGNTVYRWDDMLTTYDDGSYTSAQAEAVATLMYHCGVSVNMKYGINSSAASNVDVTTALVSYFNYDKALSYERRVFYTDDEWEEMIWNELDNNRPVYYRGGKVEGSGHAFICDGYDGAGYYHFNWGWRGRYDGYYLITGTDALCPKSSGYTEEQACIIGIQTPQEGSDYKLSMFCPDAYSIEASENPVTRNTLLTFSGGIYNNSLTTFNVSVGLMFKATASDDVYYQEIFTYELKPLYGWKELPCCPQNVLKNGEYEVYPVFKPADGSKDWEVAAIPAGMEIPRITITGEEPELIFTQQSFVPDADNVKADNVEVHFTLKALEEARDHEIFIWIYSVEDMGYVGNLTGGDISMDAGEIKDFVFKGDLSSILSPNKTYYMTIFDYTADTYIAPIEYGRGYFTVVPGTSSHINDITGETYKRVDVYSPAGIKLRSGVSEADALNEFSGGLYIVNGKKVLKK